MDEQDRRTLADVEVGQAQSVELAIDGSNPKSGRSTSSSSGVRIASVIACLPPGS